MRAINDRVRAKHTFANPSSLGSNEVVAAITNGKIRVLGLAMISTSANTVNFLSASTDISSDWAFGANGGVVLPFQEYGWFETAKGEALNITLSAAAQVGVTLVYEVV